MRHKDRYLQGEFPEKGAIFMSNKGTKKECLRRELFGLPSGNSDFVLHVKKGMTLFLFEFERRLLYGVYRATSDGEINIEPRAFRSSGKYFPAQVRFTTVWDCSPLSENEFQDAIKDNYFSEKKFRFGLNKDQVSKLMKLFYYKKISKNHPERHSDKPADRVSRFGSLRKDIRDRLRFVDKEDSRDIRVSQFRDSEVKKVDDHVYSTKEKSERRQKVERDGSLRKYVTRNVDYDDFGTRKDRLGKHLDHSLELRRAADVNLDFMVDVKDGHDIHKDERDGSLTKYVTRNVDYDDYGTRKDRLGKHLDHSLELRRAADVNLDFMVDVKDGHDIHYRFEELRGITNKDSFSLMDNIKGEHDTKDGYIPLFIEPHEKHYGEIDGAHNDAKILMDAQDKDILDYNRLREEYDVRESYKRSLSAYHLGSSCGIGSQTLADRYLLGHEAVGSVVDNIIPFSHSNQNTYLASCETGIPEIQLNPSYLADESSFIPLDSGPFYPISNEVPTFLPLSTSPRHCSHNEEPMRHFDDLGYASLSKSQIAAEGNRVYETAFIDGLHSPLIPDIVSKRLSSSDAGLCNLEENTMDNDKRPRQPSKNKHHLGTDKRVSVFARLNSSLKHDKEDIRTNKKHKLDASVDKVMEMLEKVVSSPIRRDGKRKLVLKEDDNEKRGVCKTAVDEFPEVEMEVGADQADEETEGGSELQETRLLDFKRRKKANKCIDDAFKEKSECLVGTASEMEPMENNHVIGVPCKRRKLVRSSFVEKKSTNNTSTTNDSDILTPNADCISTKEVLEDALINNDCDSIKVAAIESLEKADTSISDSIAKKEVLEDTLSNNDCDSTKVAALESLKKVDTSIKFVDISMLPMTHDVAPKEDNSSIEAVPESSEKVDAFTKSTEDISVLPISVETTLSKHDCDTTEAVPEISEKVDAFTKSAEDISVLPISLETTLSKHDCDTTEAVVETSDKGEASIKSVPLSAECQKGVNDGEECSTADGDGSADKCYVADVFVEAASSAPLEDRDNMCGWIEW